MSVDGLHETLAPVYETLRRLRILMDNRLPKCTAQEFRLLMLLFRLIDWEKQTSGNFSYEELGKKLGGASLSTISRHVKRLKESLSRSSNHTSPPDSSRTVTAIDCPSGDTRDTV